MALKGPPPWVPYFLCLLRMTGASKIDTISIFQIFQKNVEHICLHPWEKKQTEKSINVSAFCQTALYLIIYLSTDLLSWIL